MKVSFGKSVGYKDKKSIIQEGASGEDASLIRSPPTKIDSSLQHLKKGTAVLERMNAFETKPSLEDLLAAGSEAQHSYIRGLTCKSGNVMQSAVYSTNAKLRTLDAAGPLTIKIIDVTNQREHRLTEFEFGEDDDVESIKATLKVNWVALDRERLKGTQYYAIDGNDSLFLRPLKVKGGMYSKTVITTSYLLKEHPDLFRRVDVCLPGLDEPIQAAQLKCFDVNEHHLCCWVAKVRIAFDISQTVLQDVKTPYDEWVKRLPADYLTDLISPRGSRKSLMCALTNSNVNVPTTDLMQLPFDLGHRLIEPIPKQRGKSTPGSGKSKIAIADASDKLQVLDKAGQPIEGLEDITVDDVRKRFFPNRSVKDFKCGPSQQGFRWKDENDLLNHREYTSTFKGKAGWSKQVPAEAFPFPRRLRIDGTGRHGERTFISVFLWYKDYKDENDGDDAPKKGQKQITSFFGAKPAKPAAAAKTTKKPAASKHKPKPKPKPESKGGVPADQSTLHSFFSKKAAPAAPQAAAANDSDGGSGGSDDDSSHAA